MSGNIKVTRKWFFPSDFEKVEDYLCEMSREGWHLKEVKRGFGIGKFIFGKGEPKTYSYGVQYIIKDQDTDSFCKAIKDNGWSRISILPYLWNGEWHYYRKESQNGAKEQILTDNEYKLGLLKNILRSFWIIGLCLIFSGVSAVSNSYEAILGYPNSTFSLPFAILALTFYVVMLGVYLIILIPLINKISKLSM